MQIMTPCFHRPLIREGATVTPLFLFGNPMFCVDNVNFHPYALMALQIQYSGAPIRRIACGGEFSVISDINGNVYSFGCPEYGQLGMHLTGCGY